MARRNIPVSLYGIKKSNREFSNEKSWNKNLFNSTFPTALLIYMHDHSIKPRYLKTNQNNLIDLDYIEVKDVFGIDPNSDDVSFFFESTYTKYRGLYRDNDERIDLVVMDTQTDPPTPRSGLEIKLTTLPDSTTMKRRDDAKFGSEIVVRNPTVNYIACSICNEYQGRDGQNRLADLLRIDGFLSEDLIDKKEAYNHFNEVRDAVLRVLADLNDKQSPLIVQPVWKAVDGKLADDCLDVFVWSNLAVVRLCMTKCMNVIPKRDVKKEDMKRPMRTIICIYEMLHQYAEAGHFEYKTILGKYVYGGKNDKAFAIGGSTTQPIMDCEELKQPRINKGVIKEIILGGGQKYLKPERRFDAFVVNETKILF